MAAPTRKGSKRKPARQAGFEVSRDSVGDWMFGNLGGLQALKPGYKQARIAPLVGYGGSTNASCFQHTPFGRLATAWSLSDKTCVFTASPGYMR